MANTKTNFLLKLASKLKADLTTVKNFIFERANIDLVICLIIVCILFFPTLNRQWLIYDERVIYEGLFFPTPSSFSEIFEITEKFGFNYSVISSNTIYSSNYVRRTCPFSLFLNLFVSFLLKKNAFLYHAFCLSLHLLNTCLVYFILKIFLKPTLNILNRLLIATLTLIWAVHPVMLEPILLSTNYGATYSYFFMFLFLLDFLINREKNTSLLRAITIPFLFLIPMFTNEYIISLPFVLFIVSFYYTYQNNAFKKAFKRSSEETKPYFIGLVLYLLSFLISNHHIPSLPTSENQFIVFLERIFWLAPQIFFHLFKLIAYPKTLSVDQTTLVNYGETLFSPYAIFCIIFLVCFLFIPLLIFLLKRKFENIFLLAWTFFFAIFPFLHILMPGYVLAAERYLYLPLAFLIFGLGKIILDLSSKRLIPLTHLMLLIILVACLFRSHYRSLDWLDNYSFINSSYKSTSNHLLKAVKLQMLGQAITSFQPQEKAQANNYFLQSLAHLEQAKEEVIKNKNKYQKTLPLIIKSYGLDYETLLDKIAFVDASLRYYDLKQDYKISLEILKAHIKESVKLDPRVFELYANLLIQDKNYKEAKDILLKANELHPHIPFILVKLFGLSLEYEQDRRQAEKYITEAFRYNPYDIDVLLKTVGFYKLQKHALLTGRYAHMFGLRTDSKIAYQEALANYLEAGYVREINKIIAKLKKLDPYDPETLYFISKYYYQTKNYKKALEFLLDAYKYGQEQNVIPQLKFDISNNLAKLYLSLGERDKAIQLSKDSLQLAENNLDSLIKVAKTYKLLGLDNEFNYCLNKIKMLKGINSGT